MLMDLFYYLVLQKSLLHIYKLHLCIEIAFQPLKFSQTHHCLCRCSMYIKVEKNQQTNSILPCWINSSKVHMCCRPVVVNEVNNWFCNPFVPIYPTFWVIPLSTAVSAVSPFKEQSKLRTSEHHLLSIDILGYRF